MKEIQGNKGSSNFKKRKQGKFRGNKKASKYYSNNVGIAFSPPNTG